MRQSWTQMKKQLFLLGLETSWGLGWGFILLLSGLTRPDSLGVIQTQSEPKRPWTPDKESSISCDVMVSGIHMHARILAMRPLGISFIKAPFPQVSFQHDESKLSTSNYGWLTKHLALDYLRIIFFFFQCSSLWHLGTSIMGSTCSLHGVRRSVSPSPRIPASPLQKQQEAAKSSGLQGCQTLCIPSEDQGASICSMII